MEITRALTMISDLTITNGSGIVPHGNAGIVLAALDSQPIQPVANVQAYLAGRRAQPDYRGEENLLVTLPALIQAETKALVKACLYVAGLVRDRVKVEPACKRAVAIYAKWHWKLKTFRRKFDDWNTKQDWTILVNRAKAPACWKTLQPDSGLPEAFLSYCEKRFGGKRRNDGKRQAWLSLCQQWYTGRNQAGDAEVVPGYEADWKNRDRENVPDGWSYSNITRQVANRARYNKATRALLNEGESAARQFLPQHLGTRAGLRFLEKVTFDDVRMDWLVFNNETGKAEELWLLVARDEATAMVLGFVMHPATVDENGKASHLGAKQMKELAAYLLERYPLPPYTIHWVVERGTATLAEGVKAALGELFNGRIKVHYTSMIGDKSPTGYKEKGKGNSRGKASHEAHNRLFHTQGSHVAGQTGAHYGIRPADLDARVRECTEIWELRQRLPEHKRGDVRFPLTVLQTEARETIQRFCIDQNFRTLHKLEAFEEVLEWWDGAKWQPASSVTLDPTTLKMRKRMEMPVERAVRLIQSVQQWDRVSPAIIKTFLEHTERTVTVSDKGEIKFTHEGRDLYFRNAGVPLTPGTKALAYHHPDDPQFLHLTSGDGRVLGTWSQRGRTPFQDQEALAAAMRYTHAARDQAMNTARELAAPQIEELEAMRAGNAALQQFVVTAEVPTAIGHERGNVVGTMLATTTKDQRSTKKAEAKRERDLRDFEGELSELL